MRNNQPPRVKIARTFLHRRDGKAGALATDGRHLWSYEYLMAFWEDIDIWVNTAPWVQPVTRNHLRSLYDLLRETGYRPSRHTRVMLVGDDEATFELWMRDARQDEE